MRGGMWTSAALLLLAGVCAAENGAPNLLDMCVKAIDDPSLHQHIEHFDDICAKQLQIIEEQEKLNELVRGHEKEKKKNEFIRFGKRKNEFIRFGKRSDEPEEAQAIDKKKNEFIRFGKRKNEFIRFGKRKNEFIRFGKRADEASVADHEVDKKKNEFIRFGKRKNEFIRFG